MSGDRGRALQRLELAMKALDGEEITCTCGNALGKFRRNVENDKPITSEDLVTYLGTGVTPENESKCLKCNSVVAILSNGAWSVCQRGVWIR